MKIYPAIAACAAALILASAPAAYAEYYEEEYYEDDFADWDEEYYNWEDEEEYYEDDWDDGDDDGSYSQGSSWAALTESTGRDIEGIIAKLSSLPDGRDSLAGSGVVTSGESISNFGTFSDFASRVANGESAHVITATFNSDGGATLDYLDYNGYDFLCVTDNTRNRRFLGSSYVVRTYSYVIGFNGEGRAVLLSASGEGSGSITDEGSWNAAAAASSAFDSLAGIYDEIENDYTGEWVPVILFEKMSPVSEYIVG